MRHSRCTLILGLDPDPLQNGSDFPRETALLSKNNWTCPGRNRHSPTRRAPALPSSNREPPRIVRPCSSRMTRRGRKSAFQGSSPRRAVGLVSSATSLALCCEPTPRCSRRRDLGDLASIRRSVVTRHRPTGFDSIQSVDERRFGARWPQTSLPSSLRRPTIVTSWIASRERSSANPWRRMTPLHGANAPHAH